MHRTITKTGVESQGELEIPSPFVFEYSIVSIDADNNSINYRGNFTKAEGGEPIPVHNADGNHVTYINGTVSGSCIVTGSGLIHTLDESIIEAAIDVRIVATLNEVESGDIS